MDVSTFEILDEPLTPPLGIGIDAIARWVLQSGFLTEPCARAGGPRRRA